MERSCVDLSSDASKLEQDEDARSVHACIPGLFCLVVALRDVGHIQELDHDNEIVQIRAQTGTSVFGEGCSEWAMYSDEEWPVDPENLSLS